VDLPFCFCHNKTTRDDTYENTNNVPKYKCPFPECTYETEDVEDSLAAVLITIHSSGTHMKTQPTAKADKVKHPSISAAGSSEQRSCFLSRWKEYTVATKIKGKDEVIQLLECCDKQLGKDLTSATNST
jgi:hypothetical protein